MRKRLADQVKSRSFPPLADIPDVTPNKTKSEKKKKPLKSVKTPKPVIKEVIKPISPVIKVVEQPDFSPAIEKGMTINTLLAEQAIASMRDNVNNNQAIMSEIAGRLGNRPKEFIIQRDAKGDMTKVIPVYD